MSIDADSSKTQHPLEIPLIRDDIAACGWEEIVEGSEQRLCSSYVGPLLNRAEQARQDGDSARYAALWLLAFITQQALRADNAAEPFATPGFIAEGTRMLGIEDIPAGSLDALKQWLPDIGDPELKARVADVLWAAHPQRDFRIAAAATDAYLASATQLEDPAHWSYSADRVERALRLAVMVGGGPRPTNNQFAKVVAYIEAVLDKYNGEDPLFLSGILMELLQEHGTGDPAKYALLAEKLALRAESLHNRPDLARFYWRIKARWHALEGDTESQRLAQVRAAETHVAEAEAALTLSPPSYSTAEGHLEQAIHAYRAIQSYRTVPGAPERVDALYRQMQDYAEKGIAEMVEISVDFDPTPSVEAATATVKGLPFKDALLALARLASPPRASELREGVEASLAETPFAARVAHKLKRDGGRVVGTMPGLGGITDPDEWKAAIDARAYNAAATVYHRGYALMIDAARQQVVAEHNVRLSDLRDLVADSAFVPPDRVLFYARGLHAGLAGDYLVAAHLLLPQVEQSIRYVLEQVGSIPYGLDDEGIQDAYLLNKLLAMPEFEATFGEDLAFDLRGLLNERSGSNLRNEALHGLMGYAEFYGASACYFWGLTLRLCLLARWLTKTPETSGVSPNVEGND